MNLGNRVSRLACIIKGRGSAVVFVFDYRVNSPLQQRPPTGSFTPTVGEV